MTAENFTNLETPDANSMQRPLAVVAGASYGIGLAFAHHLRTLGYDLVVNSRSDPSDAINRVEGKGTVTAVVGDLSDPEVFRNFVASVKHPVSCLVPLTSHQCDPDAESELGELGSEEVSQIIDVTARVPIDLYRALLPRLAGGGSKVVFVSSDWALRGASGPSTFSAAKAALLHFCRSERVRASKNGIQITCFVLGDVATYDHDWVNPVWSLENSVEEVESHFNSERVSLQELVRGFDLVLSAKTSRLDELHLSPSSPNYRP